MARTLKPITPDKYNWRQYNRTLHQVVLFPLIKELNKRIVSAERDYKSVQRAIKNIKSDPSMAGLTGAAAKTQAAKLLKQHNAEFERTMKEHLGIRYRITDNYRVDQLMQKFIKDNVSLVKTIPPRLHAALERDIIKLQQKGPFDQKALSDTLSKNYNSAGYNLRRLTRDQTSKAVGNLNHIRQTDAGLTEYIWRTSMDERVRSSHRVLRGRRFKWSSPPPEGHPGHPIQCRCYAEGVMPPIREVKKRQARIVAQRPQPTGKTFLTPPKRPIPPPQPAKPKFDFDRDVNKALENVPDGYGNMDVLQATKSRWGNQAHKVAKSGKEFDEMKSLDGSIFSRAISDDNFLDGNLKGTSGGVGIYGDGLYFGRYKLGGRTLAKDYFGGGSSKTKGHMYSTKISKDAKILKEKDVYDLAFEFKKDVTHGKIKLTGKAREFALDNYMEAWAINNKVDGFYVDDILVLFNRSKVTVDPRSLKGGKFYKKANSGDPGVYRYDAIMDEMMDAYDPELIKKMPSKTKLKEEIEEIIEEMVAAKRNPEKRKELSELIAKKTLQIKEIEEYEKG